MKDESTTGAGERAAFGALVAAVFASAFSMPTGRALLAASLVLLIVHLVRSRQRPALPAVAWLWLIFLVIEARATIWGINPALGVPRLTKLLWFIGIPVVALLATTRTRLQALVEAYVWGAGVLAVYSCGGHVVKALRLVEEGRFEKFGDALVDAGSMSDAQRLLVGMLLATGLLLAARRHGAGAWRRWAFLAGLTAFGLLINYKRGSWFSAVAVVPVFLGLRVGWRAVAVCVCLAASLLLLPQVRDRLSSLPDEIHNPTGRVAMWTKIAPPLIREHPWGIGFRSLTNQVMHDLWWRVERDRNHLHSNLVQVLVDSGWLGLVVYLVWMGRGCLDGLRAWRCARGEGSLASVLLGVTMALLALLLNGVVEYNLADAEIVLAYGLLLGTLAAGTRVQSAGVAASDPGARA